jgi:YVTN family beta-propeller protein
MALAQPRRVIALAISATLVCLAVSPRLFVSSVSSADVQVKNQPASEGRPITPAGELVMDLTTREPAVGALPVDFVRSPDGGAGRGRYLVAINSGYGLQFSAATNKAQQSISVIDLQAQPAPAVVQNVYFPSPQSANVGLAFAPRADADGSFRMYVSGGFENKVWVFRLTPGARFPVSPTETVRGKTEAPSIDLTSIAAKPNKRDNDGHASVYPTGLAVSDDGETLFVADNLDDSLAVVSNLRSDKPTLARVDLKQGANASVNARAADNAPALFPYGVAQLGASANGGTTEKIYVSRWNDSSIAVVGAKDARVIKRIAVGSHPTALIFNRARTRLYVVNSNADTVSIIDTAKDAEIERVNVRLSEKSLVGYTPENLALSEDGATLYVANAHSNALAVVSLSPGARDIKLAPIGSHQLDDRIITSRVLGFIPTGQYPSAVAVVGQTIFVGNGKGTGFENSSVVVNNSGRVPNAPNDRFPAGTGRAMKTGGEYSVAIVSGNVSAIRAPDATALAAYTRQVMRNDGLLDAPRASLFKGATPIRHVIYVIKENRTYDELFGDIAQAGNGTRADGDASLAIFGAGDAARSPKNAAQNVTPNQRALALRFGLLDRFFVNAEASADGHNWSTAAITSDYTDKAFRWNYSSRGHGYDFEGFNQLPDLTSKKDTPPVLPPPVTAQDIASFVSRYVPYLHGGRDVAEPDSLYLWDAAARAGLSYRNYGEFIGTESEEFVRTISTDQRRKYPDITPTAFAVPTKRSLEGHFSATYRNFDLSAPDAMTTDSYKVAAASAGRVEPLVSESNADARLRGFSRTGDWLREFRGYVEDLKAGRGDHLPQLSIMRLPNDHTSGASRDVPTPQFYVADNDYAVGLIVEAVSSSPYWKDTAIFIVEDDAQDGPDHLDAHRSPALVVSAYNRPGALVHTYHSTVSLIRTIELLLGIAPMNQLDATAAPIDIFQQSADLRPYKATLPTIALDNLMNAKSGDEEARYWQRRSEEQNLEQADQADPHALNDAIWFATRGARAPQQSARLPVMDSLLVPSHEDEREERAESRSEERETGSVATLRRAATRRMHVRGE